MHTILKLLQEGSNAVHSNYCGNASGLGTTAFPSHVNEAKLNPVIRNSMPSSLYSNTLSYPVPLPPMDEVMVKGIREGQLQEKNLRNRFIRLCANYYISVKSYPTKEDYNNVCRTIITEFPDLKDPSPLPGCPPFVSRICFMLHITL